jgi:hypothetical protein
MEQPLACVVVHAVALDAGWHAWHAFAGLTAPFT